MLHEQQCGKISEISFGNQKKADIFIPWSINHSVRELSGFFKDLRGTCLIRRFIALSLPGPDTFEAEIICRRWYNIERSSLDGSVFRQHSQCLLNTHNIKQITPVQKCSEV